MRLLFSWVLKSAPVKFRPLNLDGWSALLFVCVSRLVFLGAWEIHPEFKKAASLWFGFLAWLCGKPTSRISSLGCMGCGAEL